MITESLIQAIRNATSRRELGAALLEEHVRLGRDYLETAELVYQHTAAREGVARAYGRDYAAPGKKSPSMELAEAELLVDITGANEAQRKAALEVAKGQSAEWAKAAKKALEGQEEEASASILADDASRRLIALRLDMEHLVYLLKFLGEGGDHGR